MAAFRGLYYPFIHFKDETWLKYMALYWDKIERIVPEGYELKDSETVKILKDELGLIEEVAPRAGPNYRLIKALVKFVEENESALNERFGVERIDEWKVPSKGRLAPPTADERLAYVNHSKLSTDMKEALMFMKDIERDIDLQQTDIVFAAHHGRRSGKIPNSWLDKLKPEIVVLGEASSRHMDYYSGYNTLTQNSCGDITMDCVTDKVHIYVSSDTYGKRDWLDDEGKSRFENYIGTLNL